MGTDLSFYLLLLEGDEEVAPKGTSSEKKSTDISFAERLGMAPFAPLAFSNLLLWVMYPCSLQTLALHTYPILCTGICKWALRNWKCAMQKGPGHLPERKLEAVI